MTEMPEMKKWSDYYNLGNAKLTIVSKDGSVLKTDATHVHFNVMNVDFDARW